MILDRNRFGLASGLTLPVATFVIGLALGAALAPEWSGRPMTASAATSPGTATRSIAPAAAASTRYPAEVVRVIDGDTFEARVRVWPGIEIATKVRLRNIDAPELRGRCEQETAMARTARDALAAMLAEGQVSITEVGLDKYGGRVLAAASAGRTGDVAGALLEAGVVRRYAGGRREGWCAAL